MNYVTIVVLCWTITILVCCEVGMKSFVVSVDYREYMGLSLEIWLPTPSFLHLTSYDLVGSMTTSIRANSTLNAAFVYLKMKEFLNKLWKSAPKVCQWSNPPCPYKDFRWLFKYWLRGVYLCISGSTKVWMCDDRTMLPCGLMVEVAFICELATYVAGFKLCNVAPTIR